MSQHVIDKIKQNIDPQAEVIVEGSDCSLQITIISNTFNDLNTIKRHRLVNAIFKEDILSGKLHALSLKTFTPDEANS